jgi:hypothetical protein
VNGLLHDAEMGYAGEPVMDWTGLRSLGLLSIQERLEVLGGNLQIILPAAAPDPVADGSCCETS